MTSTEREDETFSARWARIAANYADRPFLTFESDSGTETSWNYGEFDHLVARTAAGMSRLGVCHGDMVHLVLPNSVAFVAAWLACARLGASFSPSDPRSTPAELAAIRARLRPVLVICGQEQEAAYVASYSAGDGRLGSPSALPLVVARPDDATVGGLAAVDEGHDHGQISALPALSDRLAVLFTSGTTSTPKGVELTQANYAVTGQLMAAGAGLSPDDRWLVVLPLFHANAQYYCFAAAISVGASVVLMPHFSASGFLDQAARHRATHTSLFAAPIRMILARDQGRRAQVTLTHAWFAQNLTDAEYEDISDLLGCRPRQIYGMTETGPAVLMSIPEPDRPQSMGRVTPGCEVRLHALEGGDPVEIGMVGEIQVGGQLGKTLFSGYLDDADATNATMVDEGADGFVWFSTGDRASMDADGNYYFAGRGGDQLKVAGENVSVVEIEATIAEHPDVFEVAVVGRSDPMYTEVPVAYVVPKPDRDADTLAELVRAWCAKQLSPAKRPRDVHIVDQLPRTSVGKIRKFLLTNSNPVASTSSDGSSSNPEKGAHT